MNYLKNKIHSTISHGSITRLSVKYMAIRKQDSLGLFELYYSVCIKDIASPKNNLPMIIFTS